jgi:hypothetical protein
MGKDLFLIILDSEKWKASDFLAIVAYVSKVYDRSYFLPKELIFLQNFLEMRN